MVDQMLRISDDYEARAFFLKLYGDLKRYLCEIAREDEKKELVEETKAIYDQAVTKINEFIIIFWKAYHLIIKILAIY